MIDILNTKLENCPLIYRDKLTIPSPINFGLELELDKVDPNRVYKLIRNRIGVNWQVKEDLSLTQGRNAEIASPVLQNNKKNWILLKKLGELLEKLNPSYDKCSFQVNFDGSLLPTTEDRIRFLKLFAMYEDIIYRFSKGEDPEFRSSLEMYAHPIMLSLKGALSISDDGVIEMFSNNKRYGIVFKTENKDLIEFRSPNMTSNPIYWQNYVTTFYYLLTASFSNKYNQKEVDRYIDKFSKTYLLENYELEKKEKALTLSKMIFPYSMDQINFMHQYMDSGSKRL